MYYLLFCYVVAFVFWIHDLRGTGYGAVFSCLLVFFMYIVMSFMIRGGV